MKNIALQLYSVRELAAIDFEGAVRKVAAMGYAGVETAGFPGTTPAAAAKLFKEVGLKVFSAHSQLPLGEKQSALIEAVATVGSPIYVVPSVKAEDIASIDATRRVCDRMNEAAMACRKAGLGFGFHNHWAEMADLGGTRVYQVMHAYLDPAIAFEVDTYWAKVGGVDPVAMIRELGARARLLHLKDGAGSRGDANTALGTGVMDIPALLNAAAHLEVGIVEFDRCDGDVLADLKKSVDYLKAL
jgi:sugar phosphate isomerase/epimerase